LRIEQNANLMDFPKAMQGVFKTHEAFWNAPRQQIADLQLLLIVRA